MHNFSTKSLSAYYVPDMRLSLHLHCFQLSLSLRRDELGWCDEQSLFPKPGKPSLLTALWWWQRCWSGLLSLWGQQRHCDLTFMFSHKTLYNADRLIRILSFCLITGPYYEPWMCWSLWKYGRTLGRCLYRLHSLLVERLESCEQKVIFDCT